MTLTTIDRIDEYKQRKAQRQRMRSTDHDTTCGRYAHYCERCGQCIDMSVADDMCIYCPNCSTHDNDYRVYRFYPDAVTNADEPLIIKILLGSAFAIVSAAMILAYWV